MSNWREFWSRARLAPICAWMRFAQLSAAGLSVGVSCSPVLPGITDAPADLEAVVSAAAGAGARHIFAGPLISEAVFRRRVSSLP